MPTADEIRAAIAAELKRRSGQSAPGTTPAATTTTTTTSTDPTGNTLDLNTGVMDLANYDYEYVDQPKAGEIGKGLVPILQHETAKGLYGTATPEKVKKLKKVWHEYFDTAKWDPENEDDRSNRDNVRDFQRFVNTYYAGKGLKPYFDKSENFDVDGWLGGVSSIVPKPLGRKAILVDQTKPKEVKKEEAKIYNNPLPEQKEVPNEWWLQDKNNLGLAMSNLFDIKRYTPWNATPDNKYIDPVFYDPTRALAANSEMVNQGVQGAANFSNPQAFAANFSQMQGQGATQAANIVGNYADRNVGVANQTNAANTASYNQFSREKANLATNLFDKYTIMNQQFDNSRRQAKEQIVGALNQGYTNAGKTQAMNSLFPNFNIDPAAGGPLYGTGNQAQINPNAWKDKDAELMQEYLKYKGLAGNQDLKYEDFSKAYIALHGKEDVTNPNAQYLPFMGYQ